MPGTFLASSNVLTFASTVGGPTFGPNRSALGGGGGALCGVKSRKHGPSVLHESCARQPVFSSRHSVPSAGAPHAFVSAAVTAASFSALVRRGDFTSLALVVENT